MSMRPKRGTAPCVGEAPCGLMGDVLISHPMRSAMGFATCKFTYSWTFWRPSLDQKIVPLKSRSAKLRCRRKWWRPANCLYDLGWKSEPHVLRHYFDLFN